MNTPDLVVLSNLRGFYVEQRLSAAIDEFLRDRQTMLSMTLDALQGNQVDIFSVSGALILLCKWKIICGIVVTNIFHHSTYE